MFSENLHSWQDFYTTTGRTGRAKYQLCLKINAICKVTGLSVPTAKSFSLSFCFFCLNGEDWYVWWYIILYTWKWWIYKKMIWHLQNYCNLRSNWARCANSKKFAFVFLLELRLRKKFSGCWAKAIGKYVPTRAESCQAQRTRKITIVVCNWLTF